MIEFLVLPIYAASGVLFLMMAGGLVYFVFKLFTGDYSSTTKTTSNGQGSYNSSQVSSVKRHYDGYIKHGDTIPVKLFGVRDKKNRPNAYDCYGERWDDNTGHVHQLFTYEKPLVDFEPKYIETDSIDIEEYDKQSKKISSQFFDYIFHKPNNIDDYKIEKHLPIKVDSSIKQDKGWMVTLAMILADFKSDTTFRPAYDLIISNKVYLHGKYKTEIACAAYEILKDSYISDIKNESDELSANIINNLWFYFEHSDEDYFDFLKRNNFDSKYIDFSKYMSQKLSDLYNSDADWILKYWSDSNIQKDDIYWCSMDLAVSSNIDFEIRNYIIVREVPLTH